jgi:lysophospholipase L1-like esterase
MNIANADRDEVRYARRFNSGELSPAIFEPALDSFRDLARNNDFVPVILLIPGAYTAYAQSVVFNDQELSTTMTSGREIISEWLQDYAARNNIAFVDLAPAFQAAAKAGPLTHFPANVHLTPDGQRIVASQIAEIIQDVRK